MLVQTLNEISNFSKLHNEVNLLLEKLQPGTSQISCQMTQEHIENWQESIGSLSNLKNKLEKSYCHLPDSLKGSEIEKIISEYKGFRARIMIMETRKCYSIHKDIFKRVHIPIVTNDQCWMVWPYENECHQLEAGKSYITDTTKSHTFINGHNNLTRIHLVMSVD